MTVVVHAKLAPAGRARFWVGVFNRREAPAAPPRLRFGGHAAGLDPVVVRPLSAFRAGALAGNSNEPRAFTGVYEFPMPPGQARFVLRVGVAGEAEEAAAEVSPLPAQLPAQPSDAFNVLLASCYYHKGDHAQAIAAVVEALPAHSRPHLTLFLGDQVYLDLPTLAEYRNDAAWLAAAFEARYSAVWRGPYAAAMRLAPSASIPDDHEFWNNYPQAFIAAQNTWTLEGRRRWDRAARGAFAAYQLGDAGDQGAPVVFDVPPLSFFLADSRSGRDWDGRRATLGAAGLRRLREWARSAVAHQRYPVFVAGQSLFDGPGSGLDRTLPDFEDYAALMQELGQLSLQGRCPLLITGDVHYGRLAYAVDAASGRPRAFEIISSPAALVDTLGADIWNQLTRSGPWPKHPAPREPPARVRAGAAAWELRTAHKHAGNNVALLSFRRFGGGVQFKVSYWPVHSRDALRKPTELGWVDLKSRE